MKIVAEALKIAVKAAQGFASEKSEGQFDLADILTLGNEQSKANILSLIICGAIGVQKGMSKIGINIEAMEQIEIPINEEMLVAAGLA